jgi:molybdenum cofactor cytidylyltransferase
MPAAVILAAGRSSRMGRPKALLPHRNDSTTFVQYLVDQARTAPLAPILVVGRSDVALSDEVSRAGATFVVNPDPDRGQLSSLLVALDMVESETDAIVVIPVDAPAITAEVIRAVVERAADTNAAIVRTVHAGTHGHPVLFKRHLFNELRAADPAQGARAVVRADPTRVADVEVDDPSIVIDVDTREDYERLFGRRPT